MKTVKPDIGLGYFPCDTNMTEADEIKILFAKYGYTGFGIYNTIIQLAQGVHSKGYFYEASEDKLLLLSGKGKIEYDELFSIISFMCDKKLFDKKLFDDYKILSNRRMQRNYCSGSESRKAITFIKEYLLINPEDYRSKKSRWELFITKINGKTKLIPNKSVPIVIKSVLYTLKKRKEKKIEIKIKDNTFLLNQKFEKMPEEQKKNFIELVLDIWKKNYKKNKNVDYVESKTDNKHLGIIQSRFRKLYSEYDTETMLKYYDDFFNVATSITQKESYNLVRIDISKLIYNLNPIIQIYNERKNGQSSQSTNGKFTGINTNKYEKLDS